MYEEAMNRQQNMLNNLVQQKFTLESAEETSSVFETLSLATATSKEVLKIGEGDTSLAEDLKNEMAQQKKEREQLDSLFDNNVGGEDEAELLQELERLSIAERNGGDEMAIMEEMQRKDAAKLDQQLEEWERKISELKGNDIHAEEEVKEDAAAAGAAPQKNLLLAQYNY